MRTEEQLREKAFEPKFGKGGELRQKVGASGRAHLDRWLPFIVVNRSVAPADSIARRVAINSPAYLIWSPEDDGEAAAALEAILAQLREKVGPVLVIEVEDGPFQPQQPDSPRLPPFVFEVAADGSERADKAAEQLSKALGEIEVELRRPDIEAAGSARPVAGGAEADRISLVLPQIHRAPDGGFYPQITHEVALEIGNALLCAAAAFMAGRPGAPAHHGSLGRSAFLAAALHADSKLDAIARSFDFLLSLSPINTREAMHQFLESGADRDPEFRYRPLTIDPDEAKRDLYQIDLTILEDPMLERLLKDKRRELDYQLTMLATRNTPAFRAASQLLYGGVEPQLLGLAHQVLESNVEAPAAGEALAAEQVAAEAQALVDSYRSVDERFAATVEVREDVAGMLVSGPKLMIGSGTAVAANRLQALLSHEVSVHLLTYFNGATQGLTIFRTGLAHYEGIQEGLGVFAEWAVGGLTANRLRLLAGRVVAVDAMLDGADFVQVYRRLTDEFGFTTRGAFDISARVFRSGGLAKDAIYLKGFVGVLDMLASGASLEPFWVGKIAPHHQDGVEELLLRGLLHRPVFTPLFMESDRARRRIARLRDGLPFDQILHVE